jgi:hypothetical protein
MPIHEVNENMHCREGGNAVVDCGKYSLVKHGDEEWTESANLTMAQHEYLFYESTDKTDMFKLVQKDWNKEYAQHVIDGKLTPGPNHGVFYIYNPVFFDRDIDNLAKFKGDLSPADQAWVKNTRELINKYHVEYETELDRIYPWRNELRRD